MGFKDYSRLVCFAVLCSILVVPSSAKFLHGKIVERIARMRDVIAEVRSENGRITFPRSIEGNIDVTGKGRMHFLGTVVQNLQLPIVEQLSAGRATRKQRMQLKDTAFYVGSNGSFACKAKTVFGRTRCDIVGILHDNDENCFIKNEEAFCSKTDTGKEMVLDPDTDEPSIRQNAPDGLESAAEVREKRQVTEPSYTAKVISVALFFDKTFMNRFKAINNGDYAAAIQDVEEYGILVGNEWTFRYQTMKQYENSLDLAVNIAEIVYPPENGNFPFMVYDNEGRTDVNSIGNFYTADSVKALFTEKTAHHAMLITGSELSLSQYSGLVYMNTICNDNDDRKVSIARDLDYGLAHNGAHMIAHALGVYHDGDVNRPLAASCTDGFYIMSKDTYGDITTANKDTYYTFSKCTADQVFDRRDTYENCLDPMPNDFLDNFCQGPRGLYTSLNEQCEVSNGPGWATCNTDQMTATASECWTQSAVQCCYQGDLTVSNRKTIHLVYDGTPCDGPEPAKHYYCYLGKCTEGDTICGVSINPTLAPTTPSPTTPAPTTPAPTTPAPTTPVPTTPVPTTPAPTTPAQTMPVPTTPVQTTPAPTTPVPTTPAPTTPAPTTLVPTTPAPTTPAPTTPAPTTPATTPAGACDCTESLCRKQTCLEGNNNCCKDWMSDILQAVEEFKVDLNL